LLSDNEIEFASFSCYSPRGNSSIDIKSRQLIGAIKSAQPHAILSIFKYHKYFKGEFKLFFNKETTLIPIPRSSLLVDGGLWPSFEISKVFIEQGYGDSISTCLKRIKPIIKSSSLYRSDERPLVSDQLKTLSVTPEIIHTNSITLIDDVITAGRTAYACAIKINEAYPDKMIRVFSVIRTISNGSIAQIVDPCNGTIIYYPSSGKTYRKDTED